MTHLLATADEKEIRFSNTIDVYVCILALEAFVIAAMTVNGQDESGGDVSAQCVHSAYHLSCSGGL